MLDKKKLIQDLKSITGKKYILTTEWSKNPYCKGWRFGEGEAIAVAKPGTLLEIWEILKTCVEMDVIVIMQAANTGLTGGSTPYGNNYDRPILIVNTMRIDDIHILNDGNQIVGFSGSTLFGLENRLAAFDREPHSVIGSSCIGASIVGGVCNNSGGALLKRGPAYTELSLYAQINSKIKLYAKKNNLIFLSKQDFQCDDLKNTCHALTDTGKKIFWDYGHYTLAGAKFFGSKIHRMNWFKID